MEGSKSITKVLDFFVVVVLDKSEVPIESPGKGKVQYSHSFHNNGQSAVPQGLDMFCQPLGWKLTHLLDRPQFVPFALTAENGRRSFCCSLVCYQQHDGSRNFKQEAVLCQASSSPLDEENEVFFERCIDKVMYEPVCLCLISSTPMFDVLQKCLQYLYTSWINQENFSLQDSLKALSELYIPKPGGPGKIFTLSSLISVYLPPIDSNSTLPYTNTLAISLLRSIGIQNLLSLFEAILSDVSILFVSSSFVRLVDAQMGLISIIFPLELGYSFVPVVPCYLLDFLHLPSTYIMGIHSSCAGDISGLNDTILVDLDGGTISVPDSASLLHFPDWISLPVTKALKQVIDPCYFSQDYAFAGVHQSDSEEFLDKEVRAVFLNLNALLTGDLQEYMTVLRFHPQPTFYFNKKKFLMKYIDSHLTFFQKLCDSLAFSNFLLQRTNPYRVCDFFDELLAELLNDRLLNPEFMFSTSHTKRITQLLLDMMPCAGVDSSLVLHQWFEDHISVYGQKTFPIPKESSKMESEVASRDKSSALEIHLQKVPFLGIGRACSSQMSTVETDRIVVLRQFLKHLFKNELLEARKYIHTIEEYLKHQYFQDSFIRELVGNLTLYGGCVSREQYDVFARVINTAVIYEEMASRILPLLPVIYHKLTHNVKQELFTSVQGHFVWEDMEFWKNVLFAAVESELLRIYTPEGPETEVDVVSETTAVGEVKRKQFQKGSLKETLKRSLPRSAQLRITGNQVKLPQKSEGMPKHGKHHQSGECLLLLADCMPELLSLPSDMKDLCVNEEQNAIFNQIFLCIQRIIELRCPLGMLTEEGEKGHFVVTLSEWIVRFVRSVEVDLQLQERLSNRIVNMVKESISLQFELLRAIESRADKVSSLTTAIMLRPPFLKGETLKKVVHAYLLRDGKSVNAVLPAEGHLFLTMYRVIFLGTPCNHGSQNKVAIKSVSLHSLFKVKESTSCTILCEGRSISIPKVVQLRTLTSQLLKFGFEDSASGSHMISKVIQLRYPEQVKIGLPLKDSENLRDHQKPRPSFKRTRSRNQSMDYDASAISCLSQSYYCKEYSRMQLGTLNVKGSGNGQWRVSKLNMGYSVCSSYPCVVAIPEKLADQTLLGVASQFLENRFPAASWRNQSNGATLLRSSSFNYKVPKQTATVGPDHLDDNKDDKRIYGIYSAEVESMIKSIIDVTPSSWTPSTCDSLTKGVEPKSVAIAFDHPSDCEEDNEETTESVDDLLLDKEPGSHGFGVHDVLSDSGDEDDQKQQTDIDSSSLSHPEDKIVMKFSSIPTNPVDWVTVDLLPDAIRLWKHSPLYVIGDKDRFKNIPKETYSGCTFVPVEVPDIQCVMASFRKLTRACCPSSQKQQQSTFLSDVENSHWIDHLSTLLQLSVAIADLIHIQGSSVLVALEKGMDVTAQVVSLAQIILDPFYRTIEGFCHLVEKDWLAFGHPFTKRNNQLLGSALKHDLSPIFLQFLDCIHQVLTQCPSSFEFNDCFLKTVAFHYSSSRFHTFCLNCENERVEYGWCEYRQSQEAADGEEISSFWDYILTVDKNLPVFFNPFYDSTSNLGVLQIQSYQANLDIWSFYTEEYLARFPKYDFELYSCSDLTVQDIQNELFDTSEVKPLSSTDVAANYLELYLLKYIALLRSIARNHNASWRNIWEDLSAPIDDQFSSVSHTQFTKGCLDGEQDVIKMHKNTLHRQTSLAVLMKTHLSVELRDNFNKPHCFIPHTLKSSVMCDFCKHKISAKQAHKCTQCSKLCHGYCKQLMPSNCGVKNHVSHQDSSTGVEDAFRMRQGSSTFYIETERASHIYEGHLFKKGYFVKNWKQRWFVLDSEKGELSYYDPKDDGKCLGVITIKDIQGVTESTVSPVSVLPPGSLGFMFDVVTLKRTYHLMAQDDVSRVSWMLRLNKAIKSVNK